MAKPTTIKIFRTSTTGNLPNTTSSGNSQFIDFGELALNGTDRKMHSSNGSVLFEIGANTINQMVSNAFTLSGTTIQYINATSNSTQLGLNANTDIPTTWAVQNYIALRPAGSVNTAAQFTWTNTHTFSSNIILSFANATGFGIGSGGFNPVGFSNLQLITSGNTFLGEYIQNSNAGTNASGDLLIAADTGNLVSNFIDMGINSSTYANTGWTITGVLDGYLFTSNSNLAIGTVSTNNLVFFTGGSLVANQRMGIYANGNIGVGNTTPTNTFSVSGTTSLVGVTTISANTNFNGNTIFNANVSIAGNATSILSVGNTTANVTSNTTGVLFSNSVIAGYYGNVISVTTSTYTFANSDSGKIFEFNNTVATTVTLPNSAPQGWNVMAVQVNTGSVTFSNGAGSTLVKRATGANTAARYAGATIYVRSNAGAAAVWWLGGDVA